MKKSCHKLRMDNPALDEKKSFPRQEKSSKKKNPVSTSLFQVRTAGNYTNGDSNRNRNV